MRRGAADQGSTVQAQGTAAPAVDCSGLGGCAGSGIWVTQARGTGSGDTGRVGLSGSGSQGTGRAQLMVA